MTRKIKLVTIRDIKDFVNKARDYGDEIVVKTGQYVVPACSLMGVMSLDLSNPIKIAFDESLEGRINTDFDTWMIKS